MIGLMKDELSEKIMTKFVGSRVKFYSYLIDDGSEDKKLTELENKINYLEKNNLTQIISEKS